MYPYLSVYFAASVRASSDYSHSRWGLGKSFIHSFVHCLMVAKTWEYSDKNVVPWRFYNAFRGWNYPRSVQDSLGGYNEMPPGWFTDRNAFSFRCGGWGVLDHSVGQFLGGGAVPWLPACPVWTLSSPLFLLWGALTPSWETTLMASFNLLLCTVES